jgi:hypothetical protein
MTGCELSDLDSSHSKTAAIISGSDSVAAWDATAEAGVSAAIAGSGLPIPLFRAGTAFRRAGGRLEARQPCRADSCALSGCSSDRPLAYRAGSGRLGMAGNWDRGRQCRPDMSGSICNSGSVPSFRAGRTAQPRGGSSGMRRWCRAGNLAGGRDCAGSAARSIPCRADSNVPRSDTGPARIGGRLPRPLRRIARRNSGPAARSRWAAVRTSLADSAASPPPHTPHRRR